MISLSCTVEGHLRVFVFFYLLFFLCGPLPLCDLCVFLRRNGMRVITAKDGVEALEVLQDHNPDLVILDIEMPRMDGYEFAGHVRNNPDTASLPIIMVTSRTGEKHRARAIELGVNDYLGKPYQEPEMLEAIRHILGDDFNVGENVREHDVVS